MSKETNKEGTTERMQEMQKEQAQICAEGCEGGKP